MSEISIRNIGQKIHLVRGHRVMLDSDLAMLYCVETRVLNQSVRRNIERFPDDFMFEITRDEFETLMSQIVISKTDTRGGRQKMPLVFTEQGVAMLSGILRSKSAIQVNLAIMRAFVKMRQMIETNESFSKQIEEIERRFRQHDEHFKAVFDAIRQLRSVGSPLTQKRIKGLTRE
jgi:hypothetical protein